MCVDACSELFRINDEEDLVLLSEAPSEELRDKVEAAVAGCPRQAITVEEGR